MSRDRFDMSGYVDVAARIAEFNERYPEGSLQSEVTRMDDGWLCIAMAYRTPDDARPGIGHAFEPVPGKTPYTRDSECQNAETSAWGRAIVALGFKTKHIASAEEMRNREHVSEGGLGDTVMPKSWADLEKLVEASGRAVAWQNFQAFTRAFMYHQWGETESEKLNKEQRDLLFQRACTVAIRVNEDEGPLGPSWTDDAMQKAWATVLDGVMLETPELLPDEAPAGEVDDEAEAIADEVFQAPDPKEEA